MRPARTERLQEGLLAFLVDGRTLRAEVLERLGAPARSHEGGRILTYDLQWLSAGGWQRVGPDVTGAASLVLVFGPDDSLARHSLLESR